VRKALKDAGWLKKGQKVAFADEKTAQGRAAIALFKAVIKGLPLEYVPAGQAEITLIAQTADDEAESFLHRLFAGKLEQSTAMNLLASVTTQEIEKYCELERIDGEKARKSALRAKLDALDKRYPGTMFALQKGKESFK
jgi:tRNA(Ile)-lysidine synthase TilS/MesJ